MTTNTIRFQEDYQEEDFLFQAGQEWEFKTKYVGNLDRSNDCMVCITKGMWYRVEHEGKVYEIPDTVIVESSAKEISYNNKPEKNIFEYNSFKSWSKKVTTDEITRLFGSHDYVLAAKAFLGKDIRAKEGSEKTEYSSPNIQTGY